MVGRARRSALADPPEASGLLAVRPPFEGPGSQPSHRARRPAPSGAAGRPSPVPATRSDSGRVTVSGNPGQELEAIEIHLEGLAEYGPPVPAADSVHVRHVDAEGDRAAAVLRAEGLSGGVEKILGVARRVDATTMQLQYLETLKQIGASSSTKIVLPMELASLVSQLRGTLDMVAKDTIDLESASLNGEPGPA